MDIDFEIKLARDQLAVFHLVYKKSDQGRFAIDVATHWLEALEKTPYDLRLMKQVVDAALPRRGDFGLNFFAFCNHVQEVTRDEIRRSFERPDAV